MPKRDYFHFNVREALEKDGWTITDDLYYLTIDDVNYPIDLGAEQVFAAEKGTEKILVEIKPFVKGSIPNEFHTALGQFLNYETNLMTIATKRVLFLAVPKNAFEFMENTKSIQNSLHRFKLRLLIFDPTNNEIVSWKSY